MRNKTELFEFLEKEDRKNPFSRKKVGHFQIINLKDFPDWDTLLIHLAHMYRKYCRGEND